MMEEKQLSPSEEEEEEEEERNKPYWETRIHTHLLNPTLFG